MKENLFSYGTLQSVEVQLKLFGRLLESEPDALEGYRLAPVEIADEKFLATGEDRNQLTLIPSGNKKDRVDGTRLEISSEELLLTDKYEPENYRREKVILRSGRPAWIYLV